MDKIFFLSVVALFLLAVQHVRCDEIHIIPTPDGPCPGSIIGQPCFTLQQYATNPSPSSDIALKLYPGVHQMKGVSLTTSKINSFSMIAAKPASVTILCGQQQNPTGNSEEFIFTKVRTLNVSDITFIGCQIWFATGIMQSGDSVNVAFVRSSFVNSTHNHGSILTISGYYTITVKIQQCNFSNNTMGENSLISTTSVNLTVYHSIFENNSVYSGSNGGGVAIYHSGRYLTILNSNFTNNEIANNFNGNGGAIYFSVWRGGTIANCHFIGNSGSYGGAIYIHQGYVIEGITITNTFFINNTAVTSGGHGGAVYMNGVRGITIMNTFFINNTVVASGGHGGAVYAGKINVYNCSFINNTAGTVNGNGGAVYVITGNTHYVTGSYFRGNRAGGRGGAIAIDQDSNITVSNSTFTNNTASVKGGGALYCVGRYSGANTVSLLNSFFSDNTAAYCGAVHIDETYYGSAKVIGSTFTGNRAVGQVAGSNGGGVFCVRNATVSISKSIFSRNSAVGDAGVMQADECDVTITNSFLDKNTAKSNGGVLYTYLYPTSYTITQSTFTFNQVGGDGGVMFIGRAGSQVKVTNSTFSYNSALGRGGVVAIAGSTLYIDGGSLCKKNSAKLGRVASACKSRVVISSPKIPDPIYSFCSLYAGC